MLTVGFIDEDWDPTSYAPTATSSYFMRLLIAFLCHELFIVGNNQVYHTHNT